MIWIRSQDRMALIKCNDIQIKEVVEFLKEREQTITMFYIYKGDYILATYPTKQRALEVLDEIEKAIEESNIKGRQVY